MMFTPGRRQIWMSNVMREVNDASLNECSFFGYGVMPNQGTVCTYSLGSYMFLCIIGM